MGYSKYYETIRQDEDEVKHFAVERAEIKIEELRQKMMEDGDIDEYWNAAEAFNYGSFSRNPPPRRW